MTRVVLRLAILVAALVASSAASGAAPKKPQPELIKLPASGPLVVSSTVARAAPSPSARRVLVLHQFRPDFREYYVLAIGQKVGTDGKLWVKLDLQLRPNGQTGWIPASAADLRPAENKIVVHRGSRTIDIYSDGRHVVHAAVAVGSPGRETPLGLFYVTARFVPDDPFLGVFAVETSAYSKMTEWPGGGLVGIHGTSMPQLIGQAVSHGCVRVTNETALQLKKYALLGTPILITAG
jgi:lipoprotein-anchoring transpeptidase ErfK/SrfK